MCGRFTLTLSPEELQAAFPNFGIPIDLPPSYNIAPSQPIPVIINDGSRQLDFLSLGFDSKLDQTGQGRKIQLDQCQIRDCIRESIFQK